VGIVFTPFCALVAVINGLAFSPFGVTDPPAVSHVS